MTVYLFILQNGYHSEKYQYRNRQEWGRDLLRSHTGRRLSEMLPVGGTVKVVNAHPGIGKNAAACFGYDLRHMRRMLRRYRPDVICACGRIAQAGCRALGVEHIALPHPAWRQLSKKHTSRIRKQLSHL